MTGKRYGRYIVLYLSGHKGKQRARMWRCKCDCGNEKDVDGSALRKGLVQSCGCLWRSLTTHKTHGKTGTRVISSYYAMVKRCTNNKDKEWMRYGGRGIKICERWLKGDGKISGSEAFINDMGEPPSKSHSIERIDFNGNYEPDNCYWATPKQQANNKSNTRYIEVFGERLPISIAADKFNIKRATLRDRIFRYGMSAEQAVSLPVRKRSIVASSS